MPSRSPSVASSQPVRKKVKKHKKSTETEQTAKPLKEKGGKKKKKDDTNDEATIRASAAAAVEDAVGTKRGSSPVTERSRSRDSPVRPCSGNAVAKRKKRKKEKVAREGAC